MPGLTDREVQHRIDTCQTNIQVDPSTRTIKQIIKSNVFTYFNLVFVVLAGLLIFVGSFKELTFMILVVANTFIGIFQEIRSKRTLDKLKLMKMPRARAIRNGEEVQVQVADLVIDDVVVLRAGNQIPADAKVIEGSIQVNEALLTGEAEEISKNKGDSLLSGSYVVSGECLAVLTAVGKDAYISKLTLEATKSGAHEDSEMIISLDKLVKVIGIVIIPVGIVMMIQQMVVLDMKLPESVISMVAAVLGMIPEGLYITASVAMVVSAIKLARRDVLVQNLKCIEALARVDVLCVDKTGTITENEMKVDSFVPANRRIHEEDVSRLIGSFVAAQTADNATMEALKEYFVETGDWEVVKVCPFSSRYKYSGVCFLGGNYVLGAPENVLGSSYHLYRDYVVDMSERGFRVLAFAEVTEIPAGQELVGRADAIGFILLNNPVRESAPETFRYFAENDVEIKVISGDNPETVSHVAMEAGIPNADHYVDARTLVNDRAIYDAVQRFTVFGRVSPEQKRKFVRALQEQGRTVGMTGDGVNDILALKDADCSVAMASGSDAASNVAQLVLMDSNFSKMPSVVAEGRRVVNNIQRAASLYLTKNIFSILLAIFSMISVLSSPLKPRQLTLISAFTIGVPSFILALEPNTTRIRGNFLSNVLKMAAPAGLTMFISVSAMVIFGRVFRIDAECISTSATMLVALVGFLFLTKVAVPMNKFHIAMIALLVAGMAFCVIFMPEVFGITGITTRAMMLLIVFIIATEAVFRYVHKAASAGSYLRGQQIAKKEAKRVERRRRHGREE